MFEFEDMLEEKRKSGRAEQALRKVGLSFKVRLMPYAEWQKRPVFSRHGGYFAWGLIWLNFSWEHDD